MPDYLTKGLRYSKTASLFEARFFCLFYSTIFVVFALKNSDPFLSEIFESISGGFFLLFAANIKINPLVIVPVLGFCFATPSLIGENSGHLSLLIFLVTNGTLFLGLLYRTNVLGTNDFTSLKQPALVALPFLLAWLLQVRLSHQAFGQFLYTTNAILFCLLMFSFRNFLLMFLQVIASAVASLNIIYWIYFLLLDPQQKHYASFPGAIYKRVGFSYIKWGSGIITGGGHSIFHGIPRFVGFTGEPGLWGTLSLLSLGIGMTYFSGKLKVFTAIGNLLGLLASQSYSIILISLFSLLLGYLYVHRRNRPLLFSALLSSPVLLIIGLKVLKLVVLVELQNGGTNSLIQRGIGFNQNNFVSNATIYQINYLSLLRSSPVLGFLFISSLLLGIWFASKFNRVFLISAALAFTGVGILVQPIQFDLGFLILFLGLINPPAFNLTEK